MATGTTGSRAFSTMAALLGWFALTLQLILTIQLAVDHGRSVPAALWQWIDYFTITTMYWLPWR